MIKYLLLVAVLATLARSEFICTASYVSVINVTCSVYNASSVGVQDITSIFISKAEDNYLASVSFAYRNINTFSGATLSYNIQSYYPYQYLTLVFQNFNKSASGDYEGVLNGLDYENKPVTIRYKFKFNVADLDPVMDVSPTLIEIGLTNTVTVWCSGHLALHGLSAPAVVNILYRKPGTGQSNQNVGKLTIDSSQTSEATAEDPFDVVDSYFGSNGEVSFVIISQPAGAKHAGTYTCDIEATDTETNSTRHLVKTTVVTAAVATKEAIRARLGTDDNKEFNSKIITFEHGLGGVNFSPNNNDNNTWQLVQGRMVKQLDHTRQDGTGFFIQSTITSYSASNIVSIDLQGFKRPFCIALFFMAPWYSGVTLRLRRNPDEVFYTSSYSGSSYGSWTYFRSYIPQSTGPFTMELVSYNNYYYSYYYYNGDGNYLAIDDIMVTDINCNY